MTLTIRVGWQIFRTFYQKIILLKKNQHFDLKKKREKTKIKKLYNLISESLVPKNIQYHKQIQNFPNSQGVIKLT